MIIQQLTCFQYVQTFDPHLLPPIVFIGYAYAQAGRRRDAFQLLDELKRRRQTEYVSAAAFVTAYLGLANYDQTFVWLEQAYKEQSYALQTLKVLPLFDPIRSDPRFVDLLHRVGLEPPS